MDAVAAVLGADAWITLDVVVEQADIRRAIHPDAETWALQAVALDYRATRSGLNKHGGVHCRHVTTPIEQRADLDGHLRRVDQKAIALALPVQNGAWLAADKIGRASCRER